MKCKKCGASLYDGDKFCPQCGIKVVRVSRCPECGAALRKGTRFCPECGRLVDGDSGDETKVFVKNAETSDIPIADIEQNILFETEQEMKKKPAKSGAKTTKAPASNNPSVPAPPPKKKAATPPPRKRVYEDWEDEEEDDDDEEEGERDIMTIVSVVMIFLILAAASFLIFTMVRRQAGDDNDEQTQQVEQQDTEQEEDGEPEIVQPDEPESSGTDTEPSEQEAQPVGVLTISSNVNVRDYPSTSGTNVIKVAKAGEVYEYLGVAEDDNWYKILLEDGSTGYVFKEYVSIP